MLSASTLAPWEPKDAADPGTYLLSTWTQESVQKVAAFRERYWQLVNEKKADAARKFIVKGDAEDPHIKGRQLWDLWVKETKRKIKFINEYGEIMKEAEIKLEEFLAQTNETAVSVML